LFVNRGTLLLEGGRALLFVDCATLLLQMVEHKIVKDLGKEASSEESEGGEESDPEIEEVQEVGSECNTPACEKPKHSLS